ncbi:MAG: hypothetical protein Q9170_006748 [Blastenia crenularia]
MLWRLLRHPRFLQARLPCCAARPPGGPTLRKLSTATDSVPTVANALALRTSEDHDNTIIEVFGAVRTIRKQKHRAFLEIGDGSSVHTLQAVLNPAQAEGLSTGASIAVRGVWRLSPLGKEQSHELQAEKVTIVGAVDSESDFLLAQFFRDQGFLRLQPPIITSSDCEGAGETFSIGSKASASEKPFSDRPLDSEQELFFQKPKYLTVSSQLHLEAYISEHPKVWTFSPTFRAEKSDTPRHVSEFWMLEAEIGTQSLPELMNLVEDMIKSLVLGLKRSLFVEELIVARRLWEKSGTDELTGNQDFLTSRWNNLAEGSWPRITYNEAIRLLQNSVGLRDSDFVYRPDWDTGLQLEHERYIAASVGQGKPVFVTDYPRIIKPFYMLPSAGTTGEDSTAPNTAACFDLLLPELCEVAGGSLREHRLQQLSDSMHPNLASDIDEPGTTFEKSSTIGNNLDWYVDLRRFGSIPHGGFGFGFDRFLCYLAGIRNIKDVVPWPRYYGRCDC